MANGLVDDRLIEHPTLSIDAPIIQSYQGNEHTNVKWQLSSHFVCVLQLESGLVLTESTE
ncbi:hypothetical protein MUK42_05742 [Musa troglodytarum]|uniref:Uncharacterized protein n=1 Tax=Musa troglodytarum TaxID=320322 RepID=A0A9E7KX18_9LILI|nr:hypothetical protein MUK42_05742 [Musa troglodytarum]